MFRYLEHSLLKEFVALGLAATWTPLAALQTVVQVLGLGRQFVTGRWALPLLKLFQVCWDRWAVFDRPHWHLLLVSLVTFARTIRLEHLLSRLLIRYLQPGYNLTGGSLSGLLGAVSSLQNDFVKLLLSLVDLPFRLLVKLQEPIHWLERVSPVFYFKIRLADFNPWLLLCGHGLSRDMLLFKFLNRELINFVDARCGYAAGLNGFGVRLLRVKQVVGPNIKKRTYLITVGLVGLGWYATNFLIGLPCCW